MSKQRAKGTAFETAVVNWFHDQGYPNVERRALRGTKDCGDIAGINRMVLELKNCQRIELGPWMSELAAEVDNVDAGLPYDENIGALIIKRRGKTDPGQSYAVLTLSDLTYLLDLAGRLR